MERLTIRNCDGSVSQPMDLRWADALERLAAYEDTGLEPEKIKNWMLTQDLIDSGITPAIIGTPLKHLFELAKAEAEDRLAVLPFVAMIEQSLQDGKMAPQRDQKFNGRYAVVYSNKTKWNSPLIDICGRSYDRSQAEEHLRILTREEAEAKLKEGTSDGVLS